MSQEKLWDLGQHSKNTLVDLPKQTLGASKYQALPTLEYDK